MELDRKKMLRSATDKLLKLREQFAYTRKEMAKYFNLSRSAYQKKESGRFLLGLPSLYRLSQDHDISLDWYFFDKGPMCFRDKGDAEELSKKLEETQKRNEELEKNNEDLLRNIEALEKENIENTQKALKHKKSLQESPEIAELLDHMAHIPLLHHELLTHFQRFKVENRELVESSMTVPSAGE